MKDLSDIFASRLFYRSTGAKAIQATPVPLSARILSFWQQLTTMGNTPEMNKRERSKLGIFNHLNFFQFITGLLVPLAGVFFAHAFTWKIWLITSLPAVISIAVLILNASRKYREALLVYFVCYPVFTCIVYINGINIGAELSFILYGILAVFFIADTGTMLFAISFSMISYFILSVTWKSYPYQLEEVNFSFYLVNQALAIIYIFYGLYLIKTENNNYNKVLSNTNNQVQRQAMELEQLNSLKNKMFSVISHDLKSPLYALRNLFDSMHQQDVPAEDIKAMLPDIKNDLNYTVGLMENLLHWAKSQMKGYKTMPKELVIHELAEEVINVLYRHAASKNITISNRVSPDAHACADQDMINLVLRNILSNAIKFTPAGGTIIIASSLHADFTEVFVQDTGKGISAEGIKKINDRDFYSTTGTAQEQGTGLGLLLCKEFLAKNGGRLQIESTPGKGSIFSFTLPVA